MSEKPDPIEVAKAKLARDTFREEAEGPLDQVWFYDLTTQMELDGGDLALINAALTKSLEMGVVNPIAVPLYKDLVYRVEQAALSLLKEHPEHL